MNPVSNSVKNFGEDAVIIGPKKETYFTAKFLHLSIK